MYKVRVFKASTKEVTEVSEFEEQDDASFYYFELCMRQIAGEAALKDKDFEVIVPNEEYEDYCQKNDNWTIPEPDII